MKRVGEHSAASLLWLVALAVFVPVAGLFINGDLFTLRSVLLPLMWCVVLLVPYVVWERRWMYAAAASVVFADGFVNLFHWAVLRCPLNASSIFVLLNTNGAEASEFMAVKATPLLLLYVPYVVLFVMVLRQQPRMGLKSRAGKVAWGLVWAAVLLFFADNMMHQRFLRLAVPDVARAVISYQSEAQSFQRLRSRDLYDVEATMTCGDSTLVVVVVGESCNRNHMSIYGYERETTPRLARREGLMVFRNVVSAHPNTLRSVLSMFSESNIDHPMSVDSSIHLFDVLHASPYRSYWLSNQSPIGVWDNGVTSLAQHADERVYVNVNANTSKESTMIKSLDERLLAPFANVLGCEDKHRIVFLHLMGSHTQYSKRYSDDYARYPDRGDKRTRMVNTYDNAVLYNDFVVDSMLTMLSAYSERHPQVRVTALYVSDHGENVYDEGDYAGHDYSDHIPHANVEIPFMIWMSASQQAYALEHYPELFRRTDTPYMTDDLYHTIIDLCNIATPSLDVRRSFVSNDYDAERKRVLEDGEEY